MFPMNQRNFKFKPVALMGVRSNVIAVSRNGRVVGTMELKDLPLFDDGDNTVLEPVATWNETFSKSLKAELGLSN